MPHGTNTSRPCTGCHIPARHCECGLHGRPGWPGNTRRIRPEETAAKQADVQEKAEGFTFDGFD